MVLLLAQFWNGFIWGAIAGIILYIILSVILLWQWLKAKADTKIDLTDKDNAADKSDNRKHSK